MGAGMHRTQRWHSQERQVVRRRRRREVSTLPRQEPRLLHKAKQVKAGQRNRLANLSLETIRIAMRTDARRFLSRNTLNSSISGAVPNGPMIRIFKWNARDESGVNEDSRGQARTRVSSLR